MAVARTKNKLGSFLAEYSIPPTTYLIRFEMKNEHKPWLSARSSRFSFYLLVFVSLLAAPHFLLQAQTSTGSITHDGLVRDYRFYSPPAYTGDEALPLVLNLHGSGSSAFEQQLYSQMNSVAAENDFFVVYPNGIDNVWSVGWTLPAEAEVDDVSFIGALLDSLSAEYNIDPNRVYSCGMSLGGFMSYRLACEMSDRITAIGSVTGALNVPLSENCTPSRAVPLIQISGTADDTVPYEGSDFVMGMDEAIDYWLAQGDCDTDANIFDLPDTADDDCTVEVLEYDGCANESGVTHYRIIGGGHTWPGAILELPGEATCQDFSASQALWDFFNQYQLDGLTGGTGTAGPGSLATAGNSLKWHYQKASGKLRVWIIDEDEDYILSVQVYGGGAGMLCDWKAGENMTDMVNIDLSETSSTSGLHLARVKTNKGFQVIKFVVD